MVRGPAQGTGAGNGEGLAEAGTFGKVLVSIMTSRSLDIRCAFQILPAWHGLLTDA